MFGSLKDMAGIAGLLIGQVAADPAGKLRVILAADYQRLEFLHGLLEIDMFFCFGFAWHCATSFVIRKRYR